MHVCTHPFMGEGSHWYDWLAGGAGAVANSRSATAAHSSRLQTLKLITGTKKGSYKDNYDYGCRSLNSNPVDANALDNEAEEAATALIDEASKELGTLEVYLYNWLL